MVKSTERASSDFQRGALFAPKVRTLWTGGIWCLSQPAAPDDCTVMNGERGRGHSAMTKRFKAEMSFFEDGRSALGFVS